MKQLILAVLALTLALAGCGNLHGRPTVKREARPSVTSQSAASATASTVISPGIVEPWDGQTELSALESGWIARITVDEGEIVQVGQLLAVLDDAVQRHAVALAEADLEESEAALSKVKRGPTDEELQQAEAEYAAAAARDGLARAASARTVQLHAEGVLPDVERDRATADARAQAAGADRAWARLAELRRGARIEDRHAAHARVAAARSRLRVAEASLNRRQVVAASAGTVLLSRFHVGEYYNAASGPLFVVGDLRRLQVRLEVDEIDAAVPIVGAPCVIYSDAGVRIAEGRVVRLAPKMGRRALPLESPTARADVRVREVFVEVPPTPALIPNQRVWGHTAR